MVLRLGSFIVGGGGCGMVVLGMFVFGLIECSMVVIVIFGSYSKKLLLFVFESVFYYLLNVLCECGDFFGYMYDMSVYIEIVLCFGLLKVVVGIGLVVLVW